ncbi:UDP-N-acetylenolpyruvoylglucosamine reductase [Clostridium tepidiprofundi DSM 19306]|uniref:UDP-N-acetylenolpyruvoylglucosamine reductase n=1 Tax=Clostridium tepidiprofundi DSM 19306 TaxID=1121338 RepID=A0A151B673_9CLOT|nr:UDP-N-acetylmuramate dehydrogenase [Clostridium tepidiprofundi]KYH35394.1 UDP-N-acetylenolpyruvoylglucosamine reductase [Clostridium tepidiprofundi DSM 19306]
MNQYNKFIIQLKELIGSENIENDVPMKNHTTFKVGGNSDIMVTPETYEQVRDIIKLCKNSSISYFVMGKGSNILVKDGGIRGVVIKLTKLDKIQIDNDIVTAQAGASLISLSLKTAKKSLTGLEFASGIPGSVGGAVAMNAGAYGGDISKIIVSAVVIDDNLNIVKINRNELELSYRDSVVLKKGYVVLEAVFKLEKGNIDEINSTISDLTRRRKEKQPLEYASAGSTFKRPEGYYAGKLIQDSGLKGYSIGDAEVSEKHSGFIINKGNASAADLLSLISYVQKSVYKKFNVKLETEVKIIGED